MVPAFGTGTPRGSSSIIQRYACMVKMKTTKKMMVSALLILAVLSVGITPIFAAQDTASRGEANAQLGARKGNVLTRMSAQGETIRAQIKQRLEALNTPIDISDLNEVMIDDIFAQIEEADSLEDDAETVVWYLNTRGTATPQASVTDAEDPSEPLGVQLIAEKIKTTEYGKLYKVLWGRVNHDGVKVEVEGYAVLDSDGVFYMKLQGEDLGFKSIGRISAAGIGVRVAMKGYMTHMDTDYSFQMHGRAVPLRGGLIRNRISNQQQEETGSTIRNRVTVENSSA